MTDPIPELDALSRTFGSEARDKKLRVLDAILAAPVPRGRKLEALESALAFMRAHPDDATLLAHVRKAAARLPETTRVHYAYSYDQACRLAELYPGSLEIDWEVFDEQRPILEALNMLVTAGERQGLEDQSLTLEEWFNLCRTHSMRTDLELFLALLRQTPMSADLREHLWERSTIPLRYESPSKNRIALPVRRTHWQKEPLERWREPVEPLLRRPLEHVVKGGQEWIDVAFSALAIRSLEIHALLHASAEDVTVAELPRGLRIAVIGVQPEFRAVLESLYFFLIMRNDVPMAYGPAGVFLGCCEFGVNVFPEFRGSEIRLVDAQLMRVLHQRFGADYFHLTRYAMGEDNPEAIASGAFWFYRKMGFRATNPAVEILAQHEEQKMAADPSYKSGPAMLRRLSDTEGAFDLSGGRSRPFDFGRLGIEESRFIASHFDGDRRRAERECSHRIARLLKLSESSGPELARLAPVLSMIPDLARWPKADLAQLSQIVAAKVGPSETQANLLMKHHSRLEAALRGLCHAGHM